MQSVAMQRGVGAFLLLLGAGFTAWQWSAQAAGRPPGFQAAFAFPFVAVLGLMLLVSPTSRRELLERYGVDRPQSLAHYSAVQKLLLLASVLAGAANLAAHFALR
jgi:hypothetical protein